MSTDSVFARMNHRIHDVTGRLEWLPPVTIRIALGITFILSGWGKLHHLAQVEQYFASLHIPAPGIQAPFV